MLSATESSGQGTHSRGPPFQPTGSGKGYDLGIAEPADLYRAAKNHAPDLSTRAVGQMGPPVAMSTSPGLLAWEIRTTQDRYV